jgi:molybdate transport system substrate-binding protein
MEPDVRLVKGVDAVTTATYGVIEMDYIRVGIATLACSKNGAAAAAFAEFAAAPENQSVWTTRGFSPVDPTRETPAARAPAAGDTGALLVLCAAGMRLPAEAMAREFEAATRTRVNLSFDGSNRLLGQIKLTKKVDLYIAGDAEYVDMAAAENLVGRRAVLCYFVPVILVQKGNPKQLHSLADMIQPGIRIGQGDDKSAAVGRIMPKLLELNGVDAAAWNGNVVMTTPTVNELGLGIKLGTLDAVVVWDAIASKYADVGEIIPLEREKNVCPAVEGAVLSTAANPRGAEALLVFMTSDAGRRILKDSGYTVEKP